VLATKIADSERKQLSDAFSELRTSSESPNVKVRFRKREKKRTREKSGGVEPAGAPDPGIAEWPKRNDAKTFSDFFREPLNELNGADQRSEEVDWRPTDGEKLLERVGVGLRLGVGLPEGDGRQLYVRKCAIAAHPLTVQVSEVSAVTRVSLPPSK
jgi:hypothetical protein